MRQRTYLVILICLFIFALSGQNVQAVDKTSYLDTQTWGSTGLDWGAAAVVDSEGNIFVGGYFAGTVDFDPGVGTENHDTNGGYDIFISKFNSNYEHQWTKTFGGSANESLDSFSIDQEDNLIIPGAFYDTVDFDPGAGTENHVSSGSTDAFLLKLDNDGNFVWVKTFGSTSHDWGMYVDIDSNNSYFLVGKFNGMVDFDPGDETENHTSAGDYDCYLSFFDSGGNHQWTKTWGYTGKDATYRVRLNSQDDIYIVGYSTVAGDIFIRKYSSTYELEWAREFIGSESYLDSAYDIVFDSQDNYYVTGWFRTTTDFDPSDETDNQIVVGGEDVFLTKYNADDGYQWTVTWGGSGNDEGLSLAVDREDNPYVIGMFNNTVDFDAGDETHSYISAGGADIFVTSYSSAGEYNWTKTFGSTGVLDYGNNILITDTSKLLITGTFGNTVDFDPTDTTDNYTAADALGDVFFSYYTIDTTAPTVTITDVTTTSDTTPSITGTATDALGTITSVSYQIDGTSGSWVSCVADDGTFDEASEAFTCNVSNALSSNGTHIIYVRATDNSSNTSASGSESNDSFMVSGLSTSYGATKIKFGPDGISNPVLSGNSRQSNTTTLGKNTLLNSDKVMVKWERPTNTAIIDEYIIYYRQRGNTNSWRYEAVAGEQDSVHFDPGEGVWEWYLKTVYTDGSTKESSKYQFEVDETPPKIEDLSLSFNAIDLSYENVKAAWGSPLRFNLQSDNAMVIELWDRKQTRHYDSMICGSGVCDHGHLLTDYLTLVIYAEDNLNNRSKDKQIIKLTPFSSSQTVGQGTRVIVRGN